MSTYVGGTHSAPMHDGLLSVSSSSSHMPGLPPTPLPNYRHIPEFQYADVTLPISSVANFYDPSRDGMIAHVPETTFIGRKENPTLKDICENPLVYIQPPRAEEYVIRGTPFTPEAAIALITQAVAYNAIAPRLIDTRLPALPLQSSHSFDLCHFSPHADEKINACCRRINHLNRLLINYPAIAPSAVSWDNFR